METKTLDQRIESTSDVLGGKPRITGRRISVAQIVIWFEWMGRSADEIASEYDLTLADVYAALAYYYSHRAEVDESMQGSQSRAKKMREQTPSKIPSEYS
ncbi:MAG: DUF433 domain-containing protein [Anaerolineales bacterium]|nr:DUF433 domain-containing protein [Anaerolineales bacterium]MBS3753108.1 DUF433 domain-containing protein [Anaerolineales bacterium]